MAITVISRPHVDVRESQGRIVCGKIEISHCLKWASVALMSRFWSEREEGKERLSCLKSGKVETKKNKMWASQLGLHASAVKLNGMIQTMKTGLLCPTQQKCAGNKRGRGKIETIARGDTF